MYLKKLNLYGFKSFAEETELKFEPGVTAIVGPNGCGKSNLADCVKWVLGEQSAKEVRGSTMEDVIFNGAAGEEPVNIAEASLTLLNDSRILPIDYNEVTITRRVYRSGESDYLINKTKVRLKDIQDLLKGTGMGTTAYSIMQQGNIDLILSSKPQDRRYVFEEASGITKYKAKKGETLNKLQRTQENLQRVNDIEQEVERQLKSIQRKVKKAQRYKNYYEELEKLDMICSRMEYDKQKNYLRILKSDIEGYNQKVNELNSSITEIKHKIESIKSKTDEITQKIDSLRDELIKLNNLINDSENKSKLNDERIRDLNDKQKSLSTEKEELYQKIQNVQDEVNKFDRSKVELEDTKENIEKTLLDSDKRLQEIEDETLGNREEIKNAKSQLVDMVAEETDIKNELIRINSDINNYNSRKIRLNTEKSETVNRIESLQKKKSETEQEIRKLNSRLESDTEKRDSKKHELQSWTEKFNKLNEEIKRKKNEFNRLKSRYNLFKDLRQKYEGFPASIKKLVEIKEHRELKFQVLAEIIEVHKGLEKAVEMALENETSSIVVQNRKEALKIIDVLDEIQAGKCRIHILDNSKNFIQHSPRQKISPELDITGSVSDFVTVKHPECEDLLKRLLNNKFIVKDRTTGLRNSKLEKEADFITADGEVFHRQKVIAGRTDNTQDLSLIGRDSFLKELNHSLSVISEEIKESENSLQKMQDSISIIEKEEQKYQQDIDSLNQEKSKIQNILLNYSSQLSTLEEEDSVITIEIDEVTQELCQLTEEKQNIENTKKQLTEEIESKNRFIADSQQNITDLNKQREKLIVDKGKLQSELSSIQERKQSYNEKVDMFLSLLNEHNERMQYLDSQKKECKDKIFKLEQEIKSCQEKTGSLLTSRQEITEQLNKLKNQRDIFFKQREDLEKIFNEEQEKLQGKRNDLQEINMNKTDLAYKLEQIENRIADKYGKSLKDFNIPPENKLKEEELTNRIEKLSDKIQSMGPVNLMAIEEHEELKERHSFLVDQRQDLEHAEETLHKTIRKINKTTKRLFIETFDKISKEFDYFFRSLFGGGKAVLELEHDKDILESGIKIIAQPKGKKLQNISLLSGGEKTLTAIALLFAIFKVKPSPFCLLDEIDAALDEANIDRFSRVLKEFTRESQFIIITHNKKTITLADIIYGVTMEKSGISKVVSVKLVDKKDKQTSKVV